MADRLVRVLAAVVADPDQPIGRIDLLSAAEREAVLLGWNATAHAVPAITLPGLFERQVAARPEARALVFEQQALSYATLNRQSNRLAHLLIARGVGPESIVGLALPRSVELVVALLAVLKAGGAYLPLDPDYPAERLRFMLADALPICLISSGDIAAGLAAETTLLQLDTAETVQALARQPASNPTDADRRAPLLGQHPAYVIYTSGSTGRPKGVVGLHAAAVNRLAWLQRHIRLLGAAHRAGQELAEFIDGSTELLGAVSGSTAPRQCWRTRHPETPAALSWLVGQHNAAR